MEIDKLTIGELKGLINFIPKQNGISTSFMVGEKYFIRSVTHYYTGRLKTITDTDLVLEDAAWIADTVRFLNH